MIELEFFGAARAVTGSHHILRLGEQAWALDAGLRQGRRDETRNMNTRFPVSPDALAGVILSHAHIDHSGNLPGLVKKNFQGPIYATPATVDLCSVMLPDSAHIQEEDARFWNRRRARTEADYIKPLYDAEDARRTMPLFKAVDYRQPFQVAPNCRVTFHDAGHILGSAMVLLEVGPPGKKLSNGDGVRILFTGDLGRFDMPILRDPTEPLPQADYLITESTYANRRHANPTDMKQQLERIVRQTVEVRGKVIIPAFSIGRTQNLVYYLSELIREGRLPRVPVFVDSPLSSNATEVFKQHPECYDRMAAETFRKTGDLFGDGQITYITDVNESKALNSSKEPMVIIASSGMCEAGRILHHLKNNIEDERNTVVVVGFMAEHTLGRRIVERREELKIFGRIYALMCRIEVLNGFSAHADVTEFRRLFQPIAGGLKRAFAVHGEDDQTRAMANLLGGLGVDAGRVTVPAPGEKFRLL